MNTDFRVEVGLPTHPKTIKLKRLIGPVACEVLLRLFAFTAQNRPTGDLSGMDDETLAIAAGGEEAQVDLVAHLVKAGFLEGRKGRRKVHEWEVHNPYAAKAESRILKARNAALVRHGLQPKNHDKKPDAESPDTELENMLKDAQSNATSTNEQCPLPTLPFPTQPKRTTATGSVQHPGAAPPPKGSPPPSPPPEGSISEDEAAERTLTEIGVSGSDAQELVREFGAGEVQQQAAWLPYHEREAQARGNPIRDRIAFVIKAIRGRYRAPAAYTAEQADQKRKSEGFAAAKAEHDRKKAEQKRADQLDAYFDQMPADRQRKVDAKWSKVLASNEATAQFGKSLDAALEKLNAGERIGYGLLCSIRLERRKLLEPKAPADWQPPPVEEKPKPPAPREAVQQIVDGARRSETVRVDSGLTKAF